MERPDRERKRGVSRRSFLRSTVGGAIALSAGSGRPLQSFAAEEAKKSKVFVLQNSASLRDGEFDGKVIGQMMDKLICSFTGKESVSDAWKSLFSPKEKIAIKVNALFPPVISNPVEMPNQERVSESIQLSKFASGRKMPSAMIVPGIA